MQLFRRIRIGEKVITEGPNYVLVQPLYKYQAWVLFWFTYKTDKQ